MKINSRIATGLLLVGTGLVWLIYDLFAFAMFPEATISIVITDFSYYSPALPFVFGVLIDHWFIPEFKADRLLKKDNPNPEA